MIELTALFPVFVTDKLGELKAFYEAQFGFEAVFFDASFYLHLVHKSTGVQLGFLMPAHASQPEFLHAQAARDGMVISFEVADAKAAFATAKDAGLDIVMQYTEEAWGQCHFMVRDPQGFVIDLVQYVE